MICKLGTINVKLDFRAIEILNKICNKFLTLQDNRKEIENEEEHPIQKISENSIKLTKTTPFYQRNTAAACLQGGLEENWYIATPFESQRPKLSLP